jgi:hypothetical protein
MIGSRVTLKGFIPNLSYPFPRPLDSFQFEVANATGEENHPLNPLLPQSMQAHRAKVFQTLKRYWALPAVIPHVAAEHFPARRRQCFQFSQAFTDV